MTKVPYTCCKCKKSFQVLPEVARLKMPLSCLDCAEPAIKSANARDHRLYSRPRRKLGQFARRVV